MNESKIKHKPINEKSIKAKFVLSQCSVQQSFKEPTRSLSSILTLIVYIQCFKYSVDCYAKYWFNQSIKIFSYLDLSYYSANLPSLITSSIGIVYALISFAVGMDWIRGKTAFMASKVSQMLFGSVFFMWVIGDNCYSIKRYFSYSSQNTISITFSFFSLIFFSSMVFLQTFTRFDFTFGKNINQATRISNWSAITLLLYIFASEISWQFSYPESIIHSIIRNISFVLHTFIFFLKWQIEDQPLFKLQLFGLLLNLILMVVQSSTQFLGIKFGIGFMIVISISIGISLYNVQFFNIVFQLQNVNKWTNSQIMISYAGKLRKLLRNYDNYYFNTLFLGYVEIHQQKCDNDACPLRNLNMIIDQKTKKTRFQDIIKKIYNDGYKLSPVNPELQLEYSIFFYEIGWKQKSLKTLLQIKESDLPLDKYYKFMRLKKLIHKQISEVPDQQFLDLISEIKVKDLQQKITKKFEQSALISLQFWSILNQDHPQFKKLYQVGKSRVVISQQIDNLYQQISQIAHSERITALYIHYLNHIENEEKLFSQVQGQIKNKEGYEEKIIIQDWTNNSNPIMIVSLEEENLGAIIDINTTCATFLGHQKFDLIGKDVKKLFPEELANQIDHFMDSKINKFDEPFFIGFNRSFSMRAFRKIQHFNSIDTGLSLVITLQSKFQPNTGYLVFNSDSKLISMSSSSIQLLDLEQNILETQNRYNDLFDVPMSEINEEKTIITLQMLLKEERIALYEEQNHMDKRNLERTFNITRKQYLGFWVLNFQLLRCTRKNQHTISRVQNLSCVSKLQLSVKNQQALVQDDLNIYAHSGPFTFQAHYSEQQFQFYGSTDPTPSQFIPTLSQTHNQSQPSNNNGRTTKNYSLNITTLRLCDNYIKVIEQQSEQENEQGDLKSQASTNNELIQNVYSISKADQQKIFDEKKNYHKFVDKNSKKIFVGWVLGMAVLGCCGYYVGLFFLLRDNYNSIQSSYYRYALGNRVIGQIAQANRIILQSKYHSLSSTPQSNLLLLLNYNKTLDKLQNIMINYTNPYIIDAYIDRTTTHQYKSDEYILSFISQFAKIRTRFTNAGNFNGYTGQDPSSIFIQINGNVTKDKMYVRAENFKNTASSKSANSLQMFVIFNIVGVVVVLLLTFAILFAVKKVNEYKVQILSVFLETTDKDLQNYSQKTQNFLVTLHVDQSNQNNEHLDQQFENKKNSGAMFTKKKRFKQINFEKTPYIIFSIFFFFASGFFIHLFSFSIQKNIFIQDAIQYFGVVSKYADVFGRNQAKIYKQLYDNFNSTQAKYDPVLSAQINSDILTYERDFFIWHYRTYGSIEEYHQKFAKIFMRSLCDAQIKIEYACDPRIMAQNGTLLMITDVTIQNQNIDYSKPLAFKHFLSIQVIKQVHWYLLNEVFRVSQQFFITINTNIIIILFVWIIITLSIGILLGVYFYNFILEELRLVKCMLKFFPLSFAKNSEGVKRFVGAILDQGA